MKVYIGFRCPRCKCEDCIPGIVHGAKDICAECAWPEDFIRVPLDFLEGRRKWQPHLDIDPDVEHDKIKENNDV